MIVMGLSLCCLAGCGDRELSTDKSAAEESPIVKAILKDMVEIPGESYKMKMGKTEVTQAQWEQVMGSNPSHFKGADRPVENVSWNDCQQFIQRLNEMSKNVKFRLPTDEEWEYCCRAGGTGDWGKRANGEEGPLDVMGWYEDNSGLGTHPVAQKEPNAWGLYDMHGNVCEWTSTADGDDRVCRGGSWFIYSARCAAGNRYWDYPGCRSSTFGFRLVSEIEEDATARKARLEQARKTLLTNAVDIPGRNYKMGKTEVTQDQWESVMGTTPSRFKGRDRPVENVSWNDVQEFIEKLNNSPEVQKAKVKFRLPTEEEWEYCCLAGGTGDWGKRANGEEGPLDVMGWYRNNSGWGTHPVAQKEPNAWGLYDMHCNVNEWTSTAVGDCRVSRGGSWLDDSRYCAVGCQGRFYPGSRYFTLGFRLVSEDL